MADGAITVEVNVDDKKAAAELEKFQKKVSELEDKLQKQTADRAPIVKALEEAKNNAVAAANEVDRIKRALAQSEQATSINGPRVDPQTYTDELAAQERLKSELTQAVQLSNDADKAAERIAAQDERALKAIADTTAKLDAAKSKAGGLVQQMSRSNSAAEKMDKALAAVNQKMDKFAQRIKGLAKRVFIFTLITAALRGMRTWLGNAIKSNDQAVAAIARLKGALLTLGQPLLGIIIPALTKLVNILAAVIAKIAQLVSGLFGKTAAQSAEAAKKLYDEQQALSGVGSAAKKAGKSLASFDEINQLQSPSSDGSGGSSSSTIAPDFGAAVSDGIDGIVGLFSGIALLAVGAMLAFTGFAIPLGIALMVAGAATVYTALTSDPELPAKLIESGLDKVLVALSTALLALGAFFAFSGVNIGIGAALMLAGAAALGSAVVVNWDTIVTALQGPIGKIVALVSGALLVLGAILTFSSPASIGLGIALMAAGAAGIAATVAVNWDSIVTALQGPIGKITALVGAALLVLGICLLFTGAGVPLGLGLILAGAVGLAAPIAANWNFIVDKVKGVWLAVKGFWNKYIAPVFTKEWWANLAKTAMNGFLAGIEAAINWILSGIGKLVNGITGLLNKIPGIDIDPVDWGHVQLPRLASGAVIPPNREFLAVLGDQKSGTNIEAPMPMLVDAFTRAAHEIIGGGGSNRPIYLMLDGRELGRAVLEVGDQESVRVGVSLT